MNKILTLVISTFAGISFPIAAQAAGGSAFVCYFPTDEKIDVNMSLGDTPIDRTLTLFSQTELMPPEPDKLTPLKSVKVDVGQILSSFNIAYSLASYNLGKLNISLISDGPREQQRALILETVGGRPGLYSASVVKISGSDVLAKGFCGKLVGDQARLALDDTKKRAKRFRR